MTATSKGLVQNDDDANAYHDIVSAAVDLKNVTVRNGLVSATRSVRDIDTNSRRQFIYNIPLVLESDGSPPFVAPPIELPTKVKARVPSPSGSKIAILVEENINPSDGVTPSESKRHIFEIWTNDGHRLANRIILPSEKHGPVCTDFAWFGGISWSPDEIALVYTAEINKPKTASFFKTVSGSKEDENIILGGQYTLGVGKSENWGEKYGATALLALFCLNVETADIGAVENVPGSSMVKDISSTQGGYVLGQPIFSPCGEAILYTGWDAGAGGEMPRRLGAIYCFHRPCKIYASPVTELLAQLARPSTGGEEGTTVEGDDAPFVCITPNDRLARSARFSKPVGETACKLAYLCNTKGFDTHGGCMALHVGEWDMSRGSIVDGSTKTVVDVVRNPGDRGDETKVAGIKFPGLFLNQLPDDCFSMDGTHVMLTTQWGSVTKAVSISLNDGTVSPTNFDLLSKEGFNDSASQQFVCFTEDGGAIVTQSEANRPTVLGLLQPSFLHNGHDVAPSRVLAQMQPISVTSFSSLKPDECFKPGITGYSYRIISEPPIHGILLLPDNPKKEKVPLIVVPHGGPHSCTSTAFVPSYGFLCKHGQYAILHVNYQGSSGFGQATLESLAGNAGSLDVDNVVAATRMVTESGIVDPNRVGICGGSHGGFLAGHCIGQYPDIFKVAATRNPVMNIASMVTATDIPDWCYVEALGIGHYNFSDFRTPTKDELAVMWDKSPIAHIKNATAPTLIGLGMNDRRVPPSQGIEYYHALRAKKVPTKLLVYEDCDHAIDGVSSEADFWLNTKRWFDKYL